ncbi:MAG: DinB family protein [Bacteroidota bacterium]
MTNTALNDKEFDPYYGCYIYKVNKNIALKNGFEQGKQEVIRFFEGIPQEKLDYRYEDGKWNCKEILQHLIDTERIFMYRCFRIARNDQTPLAGFDQNVYIAPSGASEKSLKDLLDEFIAVRDASISMLNSLNHDDLINIGYANAVAMSARAAAFTIIGHEIWHLDIIKERYL